MRIQKGGYSLKENICVTTDADGNKVVLIHDIRFRSRRTLDWNDVERYLKEYVGKCVEIEETSELVYIGSDFPDEFSHSLDTKRLQGANKKAKANITPAIEELVGIATNKKVSPDYENKHGARAKLGWYRYDIKFGLPIYDENGELIRYNIYNVEMLVRCDENGKLYLYDFVRTKKETSRPHE